MIYLELDSQQTWGYDSSHHGNINEYSGDSMVYNGTTSKMVSLTRKWNQEEWDIWPAWVIVEAGWT